MSGATGFVLGAAFILWTMIWYYIGRNEIQ